MELHPCTNASLLAQAGAIAQHSYASLYNLIMINLLNTPPSGAAGNMAAITYIQSHFDELLRSHYLPVLSDIACFNAIMHLMYSVNAPGSRRNGIGQYCDIHPGLVPLLDKFHAILEAFRLVYGAFHGFFIEACFKAVIGSDYSYAIVKVKVAMTMFSALNLAYPRVREKLRSCIEDDDTNDIDKLGYQMLWPFLEICIPAVRDFTYAYETNNFILLVPALSDLATLFMAFGAHDYAKAAVHQLALFERMRKARHPVYKAFTKLIGHHSQKKLELFHGWLAIATDNAPVGSEYEKQRQCTVLHNPFRELKVQLENNLLTESERTRQKRKWETRNQDELVDACETFLNKFIDETLAQGCNAKTGTWKGKKNVPQIALKANPEVWISIMPLAIASNKDEAGDVVGGLWGKAIEALRKNFRGHEGVGKYNDKSTTKKKEATEKIHGQLKRGFDPETRTSSYALLATELGGQTVAFDRTTSKAKSIHAKRKKAAASKEPPARLKKKRASSAGVAAVTVAAGGGGGGGAGRPRTAKRLCASRTHIVVEELPI